MIAIVAGMIATYPVGGTVWDYGQYALGLERLGFDVWYLEDTGAPVYDPTKGLYGEVCDYSADFLGRSLRVLSPKLGERWHFRHMDGRTFGVDARTFAGVLAEADLFLNVSGGTLLRDEYVRCRRKVLIDSDPGWNHFRNYPRWDANPGWLGTHGYRAHDYFFTYAERIGRSDCALPSLGLRWWPTRPPVVLDCWQPRPPGEAWTTVLTWKNFQETIEHQGVTYGTKEMEFPKVAPVPSHVRARCEVATGGATVPREEWRALGWSVVDAAAVSATAESYRHYIEASRGELSVAKNVYVATRSGWFSCRTACYLAAGRPAVVQDTGFSESIPTGSGLIVFDDLNAAVRGVEAVENDYSRHSRAARELAVSQFDSDVVLSELLNRTGL